jgi:RES domain-containing protein
MATAWRIAVEARSYHCDDMTGAGAKETGGRWNEKGTALVYASPNIGLAVLETLVHIGTHSLPLNRYLIRIDIPDEVLGAATVIATPPIGWDARPAGLTSIEVGEQWVQSGSSAILRVPSVIVPEELNILINPAHRDAKRCKAAKVRRFVYDDRLRP